MPGADVEVVGLDRLTSTLVTAGRRMEDLASVNRAAAQRIANASRPPVATGALAASRKVTATSSVATVAYRVRYARFPEYGTKYMTGRHYLSRAFTSTRAANQAAYADHVRQSMATVKGA